MTKQRLAAYLDRIGLAALPPADIDGLAAVVAAHRQAIPFENLDVPLGRGIAIDGASVHAKLVGARRGGYCFEQNRLLGDMLAAMGFALRPLLARVRLGLPADAVPPRTHTLLLVDIAGEGWIADGGFGGSFVPPLPLVDGALAATPDGAEHRLLRQDATGSLAGEWLLERRGPAATTDGRGAGPGPAGEGWAPQYSFDLAEVAADDLEQANHWTATRPATRFTANVIASRVVPQGFVALTGRQVSRSWDADGGKQEIASPADLQAVLAGDFGIAVTEAEAERLFAFAAPPASA